MEFLLVNPHELSDPAVGPAEGLCPCTQISLIPTHWKASSSKSKCDQHLRAWEHCPPPHGTQLLRDEPLTRFFSFKCFSNSTVGGLYFS